MQNINSRVIRISKYTFIHVYVQIKNEKSLFTEKKRIRKIKSIILYSKFTYYFVYQYVWKLQKQMIKATAYINNFHSNEKSDMVIRNTTENFCPSLCLYR